MKIRLLSVLMFCLTATFGQENPDTKSFITANLPWIVALIIGVISAVVNLWAAHQLKKSNENTIQKQIDSAKETTLMQFKTTIATKNRQDWIDELRDTISEYIMSTSLLSPIMNATEPFKIEQRTRLIERMSFSKAKIQLLTNIEKPDQKALVNEVESLLALIPNESKEINVQDFQNQRSKVIEAATKILNLHWRKIKELN